MAVLTFLVVVGSGIKKMGLVGFLKAQAPHMDLPPGLGLVLVPMIWLIEVFGLVVKHVVLAIRLFANMFGGHLVLAAVLGFVGIGATVGSVIATLDAVIPAAVGVDIGCGMMAVQTTLRAADLPDHLAQVRSAVERAVPHGRTDDGGANDRGAWGVVPECVEHSFGAIRAGLDALVARNEKLERAALRALLQRAYEGAPPLSDA